MFRDIQDLVALRNSSLVWDGFSQDNAQMHTYEDGTFYITRDGGPYQSSSVYRTLDGLADAGHVQQVFR
jgi:Fe2+ or Zn2+ uptake regulation protein